MIHVAKLFPDQTLDEFIFCKIRADSHLKRVDQKGMCEAGYGQKNKLIVHTICLHTFFNPRKNVTKVTK